MHFIIIISFCVVTSTACKIIAWNPFLQKQHIAALVLARGGSKGIPLKNLQKIDNQSLINISLTAIKGTGIFDAIWLSTDHDLIARIAMKQKVNVHIRPLSVSTDEASSLMAVQEFLGKHKEIDVVGLVQCTSPFVRKIYLKQAFNCFHNEECDCAFAVTRSHKFRWLEIANNLVPLNFNPRNRPRRQDWTGELVETGMFYFAKRKLIEKGHFQNDRCKYVEISERHSIEVDSYWDLLLADKINELLKQQ